jgi:pheromone shutdown protein TraB
MDPIVLAFGTALVGAIATSTWQQVRDTVAGIWRRIRQQDADGIGAELDELRVQILQARREGDAETETALEGTWQVKLQQLLQVEPAVAAEMQRVLEEVLTPALTPAEQTRVGTIMMMGSSHDSSTFTQIGIQAHFDQR